MKEKNLSIELLKFLAVIIVANSHMDPLYGQYGFFLQVGRLEMYFSFLHLDLPCF